MRIIRADEVCRRVGYSKMHIWRMERAGHFPRRLKLGARSVGWIESEIEAWIKERLTARDASYGPCCALCGRSADQVSALVAAAHGSICDECIGVAHRALATDDAETVE